ncbi:phage major capsid protein, HK97 family [Thermoanaerobacter sp. YS13]|uniref:phage major capsid protein n=1 Tax=Thermoanaerobacter sp. YS13 TaxID=1511746 RepID=UPI0005755932|nr:phage major capsid protein [Thermoanaerobacter sp. YS13]KHO62677.1 phage major capsid protein, HK97 family [Thermoanaerobacter sp. YS13]
MTRERRELLNKLQELETEAKELLKMDNPDVDKVEAITKEIRNVKVKLDALDELERDLSTSGMKKIGDDAVDGVKVFCKVLKGEPLTDVEAALLTTGSDGESYLIPPDVKTKINELRRQYKSARPLIGSYPTNTLSGQLTYEDISTVTELTDFTDGQDLPTSNNPKFTVVNYSVKPYGAILPISRTLLQNETGGLLDYIGRWFNKKAVRTENKKIFATLQLNKTPKELNGFKALKKSLNVDIDPALSSEIVIVTNQDGFAYLDDEVDSMGRPILQPDPTQPTQKLFMGYPVVVFSNTELPSITDSTGTKAPIFYGALNEGAIFVDRGQYEFSSSEHAGFTKNQVFVRIIEYFDVIQADKDAYVYGELKLA